MHEALSVRVPGSDRDGATVTIRFSGLRTRDRQDRDGDLVLLVVPPSWQPGTVGQLARYPLPGTLRDDHERAQRAGCRRAGRDGDADDLAA